MIQIGEIASDPGQNRLVSWLKSHQAAVNPYKGEHDDFCPTPV